MALTRRIRGTRTKIPAGKIIGRLPATGAGSAQVIDPADLGRALISSGVVAPMGAAGGSFTLGATLITVNGSTYSTVNNLTLSTPTMVGQTVVEEDGNFSNLIISGYRDATNLTRAFLTLQGSRGSLAAPTALQNNDIIASVITHGHDGTNFNPTPVRIQFTVDGTVSTGIVPGRISFSTTNVGGTFDVRIKLYSSGGTYFGTGGGSDPGANNVEIKGELLLDGSTSGTIALKAPAVAGSNTIVLPAGTTDFSATGGPGQYVKQASAGGAFTVGTIPYSDITNPLYALVSTNPDGTIPHNPDGTLGYVLSPLP